MAFVTCTACGGTGRHRDHRGGGRGNASRCSIISTAAWRRDGDGEHVAEALDRVAQSLGETVAYAELELPGFLQRFVADAE